MPEAEAAAAGPPAAEAPLPLGLLAELTHRCPLRCPYCSNPLELARASEELSLSEWLSLFGQARAIGILQVHLSGGEPAARRDLAEIVAGARAAGLYTNLITSGLGLDRARLAGLAQAGLDHVQLSFQGAAEGPADAIAGVPGAFRRKLAIAAAVRESGLPLTVNFVLHRRNIEELPAMLALAVELGALRVEIAHAQYHGWALINRPGLLPARAAVLRAAARVEQARAALAGLLAIDHVVPDYFARRPKACMGGWGRRFMVVAPNGDMLPCHAARSIPGIDFPNARTCSLGEAWTGSDAFGRFRGTQWMPEPCRSCDRREIDWGGCRCQALALAGDAATTDPVCDRSPLHGRVAAVTDESVPAFALRPRLIGDAVDR